MLSREQWLEKYRHRWTGMLLDAMFGEHGSGGELSVRMRTMLKTTDQLILEMYNDALQNPAQNGAK